MDRIPITPRKTPASCFLEYLPPVSDRKRLCPSKNVQMGTVPLKIPARPAEIRCSAQTNSRNGNPCAIRPPNHTSLKLLRSTMSFFRLSGTMTARRSDDMARRMKAENAGGAWATALPMATNEPPQSNANAKKSKNRTMDKGVHSVLNRIYAK